MKMLNLYGTIPILFSLPVLPQNTPRLEAPVWTINQNSPQPKGPHTAMAASGAPILGCNPLVGCHSCDPLATPGDHVVEDRTCPVTAALSRLESSTLVANDGAEGTTGTNGIATIAGIRSAGSPSILEYGAVADEVQFVDGITNSGSPVVNSAGSNFTPAAVGKSMVLEGVGKSPGGDAGFLATIVSVQTPHQVTLSANVEMSAKGVLGLWGTNDTVPFNTALRTISVDFPGTCLTVPVGNYLITDSIQMQSNANVCADPSANLVVDASAHTGGIHPGINWNTLRLIGPPLSRMLRIRPAVVGATTLTCLTTGCWSGLAAGQYIWIAEGSDPAHNCANALACLFDNVRQFGQIDAISGDTITLDRPLEFNFNGSTYPVWAPTPCYDGVFTFSALVNSWWKGGNVTYYHADKGAVVYAGWTVNSGIDGTTFTPVYPEGTKLPRYAGGYFSNVLHWTMQNTVWTDGLTAGCSLSQYCTYRNNTFKNIGNTGAMEIGQAQSFTTYEDNKFFNVQYILFYIEGSTSFTRILNNVITTTGSGAAVEDLGGQNDLIQGNYIVSPNGGAIGIGTANNFVPYRYSSDVSVIDNTIVAGDAKTCILVGPYPSSVNLTIKGNHCTNPLDVGINMVGGFGNWNFSHNVTVADNSINSTAGQFINWPFGYGNAVRFSVTTPSAGPPGDYQAGDIIIVRNATAQFGSGPETVGEYVTVPGTVSKALGGVTVSTRSGSNAVTFNSAAGLHAGGWISIAGVGRFYQLVTLTGTSGTLNFNASATVASAAVAWQAPRFAPIMPVDMRAYRSTDGASPDPALDYFLDVAGRGADVHLPQASLMTSRPDSVGKQFVIRNHAATGSVTVTASTGTQIDGLGSITLPNPNDFLQIHWDGTNWDVMGGSPSVMSQLSLKNTNTVLVTIGTTTVKAHSCTRGSTASLPGLMPTVPPIPVAAWSITSGVASFTASNTLDAGQSLILSGFRDSTFFNGRHVTVLSKGLSGSQFQVNIDHANGTAREPGSAGWQGNAIFWSPNRDISNVAGWSPTGSRLDFSVWAIPNTLNYKVCNGFDSDTTPGASTSWNFGYTD